MNFEEALIMMKDGCKVTNPRVHGYFSINENGFYYYGNDIDEDDLIEIDGREYALGIDMISNNDICKSDDWEEYKGKDLNLLTYQEQSYLNYVLTPFKDKKITIKKETDNMVLTSNPPKKMYHIVISIDGKKAMKLPSFVEREMYSRMIPDLEYTAYDLGLFEEKEN